MAGSQSPGEMETQQSSQAFPTITLNLVIRFSHSDIPDVSLPLPLPDSRSFAVGARPSVNNVKGKLRSCLPKDFGKHGLKLIYAGRVLNGLEPMEKALKLDLEALGGGSIQQNAQTMDAPVDRPLLSGAEDDDAVNGQDHAATEEKLSAKAKGKRKAQAWSSAGTDNESRRPLLEHGNEPQLQNNAAEVPTMLTRPFYLHCAITPSPLDVTALATQRLLESEPLSKEFDHRTKLPYRHRFRSQGLQEGEERSDAGNAAPESSSGPAATEPTTDSQPRGFDRLLAPSSGFSASDVRALRSQFRHVIEARYTPDTMPSPTTLLRMEESWLDDSSYSVPNIAQPSSTGGPTNASAGAHGGLRAVFSGAPSEHQGTATTGGGYTDDDAAASLDDTYFGVFIGFFWPLGACVWGLREEGVWSRRRGRAVMAGILINILFGVVKVLS